MLSSSLRSISTRSSHDRINTSHVNVDDNHLAQLPEELLQETLTYLDESSLLHLALTCQWSKRKALSLLWRHVELVDCRSKHTDTPMGLIHDHHDDGPIIKKLVVLAS